MHDEIAQLSSLEHEQDIVGNTLKGLTKDAYEVIGQQLGFVDGPKPQPTTVEDSKTETMQDRVEAVRDAHNVEVVSSSFTPATNSAVVEDSKPKRVQSAIAPVITMLIVKKTPPKNAPVSVLMVMTLN